MPNILKRTLKLLPGINQKPAYLKLPKNRPLKKLTERELIQLESEIGRNLFGPIPSGHRREFFCLDEKTWIWYEEFKDQKTGKKKTATTRYELKGDKVLKAQEGARYSYIEGDELKNLLTAIGMYYEKVARNIYKRDPQTGQKLA